MRRPFRPGPFQLFRPPYRDLEPVSHPSRLSPSIGLTGAALIWCMSPDRDDARIREARLRPGGLALITVLPPADQVERKEEFLRMIEFCRPASVLPFHEEPHTDDLRCLLSAPPDDFAGRVVDYLRWRGLPMELDIRHMVRRTLDLSADLRSVNALARGVYLSRRALGRRFTAAGLPVPSHWLHAARVLRAVIRIQDRDGTLASIAYDLGYPDAFALSNQMKRLTGVRPSEVRDRRGWEWFFETWLRKEAREGGFSPDIAALILRSNPGAAPAAGSSIGAPVPDPESTSRVAPTRVTDPGRVS